MTDDATEHETPTRRGYVKYSGAIVGGGLLMVCAGEGDTGTGMRSPAGELGATTTAETPTTDSLFSVRMSPAGTVELKSVLQAILARQPHDAEMAVSVSHGAGINALHAGGYYNLIWNKFFERRDGISVDWADIFSSTEFSKEKLK